MQDTTRQYRSGTAGTTRMQVATGDMLVSGKAIGAFVCGILGLFLGVFILPILLSVAAVILGNSARKEIAADPTQKGNGLAMAGIVLGWTMIGLAVLALVWVLVTFVLPSFSITPAGLGAPPGGPGAAGGPGP